MSGLKVPTITEDDLRTFHLSQFGHPLPQTSLAADPSHFFAQNYEDEEGDDGDGEEYDGQNEEDDGLGHYPDGTKRTLTDEQIAIFRHTEIQTLLRERRRRRAAEATGGSPQAGEPCQAEIKSVSRSERKTIDDHQFDFRTEEKSSLEQNDQLEFEPQPQPNAPPVEADVVTGADGSCTANSRNTIPEAKDAGNTTRRIPRYQGMNVSQRKNMNRRRKHRKKMREERRMHQKNEAKTPRRIAREKDEQHLGGAQLDYDNVDAYNFEKDGEAEQADINGEDDSNHESEGAIDEECESGELNKSRTALELAHEQPSKVFVWPQIRLETAQLEY
ncbi:hypothetical protein EV356DRAFT_515112 [Viridothelium virens]|uniref:Uncharacterized protein n=1 Tax=Viridothelium virens TaxID=1048519 RepID=A0A6A6HAA2_VIRVR|nr:hypothetical protein EV356DRAFT_515112 [Viridothelium virens]